MARQSWARTPDDAGGQIQAAFVSGPLQPADVGGGFVEVSAVDQGRDQGGPPSERGGHRYGPIVSDQRAEGVHDPGRLIGRPAQGGLGDTSSEDRLRRSQAGRRGIGRSHVLGRQRPLSSVGEETSQHGVRQGLHPDSLLV